MATIAQTPVTGQRLQNIASVSMGPRLGAEAFGGSQAREVGALGQAIQGAGQAAQRVGIMMWEERARNWAIENDATLQADIARYRNQVLTEYTGDKAHLAPEDIEKYAQGKMAEALKNAPNDRAREILHESMRGFNAHNQVVADAHVIRQNEVARINSREAKNAQLLNEAASLPDEKSYNLDLLGQMKANNAEIYRNQPQEVLDLKNQEAAMAFAQNSAASLAQRYGPEKALALLNDPDIAREFQETPLLGKYEMLKATYRKASENIEVAKDAHEYILNGGSSTGLLQEAWEKYPDDKEKRDLFIAQGDTMLARQTDDENRATVEYNTQKWQEFANGNDEREAYSMETINEVMKVDPVVASQMLAFRQTMNSLGMKNAVPDIGSLDSLYAMEPEQLRAHLANPENYRDFLLDAAGDAQEISRITSKSRMTNAEWQAAQDKGASARFGDVDFDAYFANNFLQFGKTPGQSWILPDATYNPKNAKHSNFKSNVLAHFRYRWARPEQYPGKSPETRAEDLFYGLIDDSAEGRLDLTRPTYQLYQESRADAESAPVDATTLPPAEQAILNTGPAGNPVATEIDGRQVRVKEIDPRSAELHVNLRSLNPVRVYQNLQKTRIAGRDIPAGYYHAVLEDATVRIFQPNCEYSGWVYRDTTQTSAARQNYLLTNARKEWQSAVNAFGVAVANEVKDLRRKYPDEGAITQFETADELIIVTPEGTYFYDRNGKRSNTDSGSILLPEY